MIDYTGVKVGEYRLLRRLGIGAFGAVYLGVHIYLGTQAAVKVLHTELAEEDWRAFLEEARKIAALQHPHIVRLLSFALHERTPYLVMQLAPQTLKERFPKGQPQPLTTILPYVRQTAEAIQYAHDQQLLHLDIKPANLLLTEGGEVLLADFGIARVLHTQSTHVSVAGFAGTPIYAAPEQFQGKPTLASDQYALAVVIYEWLTGTWPFQGDWFALGHQKLSQDPPPLRAHVPTIPPEVEQVVLNALARDPKARFERVRAFAEALEQAGQVPEGNQTIAVGTVPPANGAPTTPATAPEQIPMDAEQWRGVGLDHRRAKRDAEALAAFERALQLHPSYAAAHTDKGALLCQLQRYEEALAVLDNALRLDPASIEASYWKGQVLDKLQRYEEALAAYDRTLQLNPAYQAAYLNKGDVLKTLQRYEEALATYDRVLLLDSTSLLAAVASNNKGDALCALGRYEEALAAFERALRLDLDPMTAAATSMNKGLALARLKRAAEAQAAFEEALRLAPTPGLSWIIRAKVQEAQASPSQSQPGGQGTRPPGAPSARASRSDQFIRGGMKSLKLAQEEAQRFNHPSIGTEHLLLGLVREGEGVPARVLHALGVNLTHVQSEVERMLGRGAQPVPGELPVTSRAKQVIELAIEEASRLDHHSIGPEHLLLGLVREGESRAAGLLLSLGVTLERVRTQTLQVLSPSDPPRAASDQRSAQGSGQRDRDRVEQFSERARKVLSLAQEEAQRFDHNYIGSEHLLLGLIREDEGVAAKVLRTFGAELTGVRSAVECMIGRGNRPVQRETGLTPRAKQVIELAIEEAHRLNHHSIGPEHLLLGVLRAGEGIANGILESLGIDQEKLCIQTLQAIGQPSGPTQIDLPPSNTPTLDQLSLDLTAAARAGTLTPVIGREQEIERVQRILLRRTKHHPLLIGKPGVGKTAIVNGLAQRIAAGTVPDAFAGQRLLWLDLRALVADAQNRAELEARIQKIVEAMRNSGECLLCLDPLSPLINTSGGTRRENVAAVLKAILARGELSCIGASTPEDYKLIRQDALLRSCFQEVPVPEATVEGAMIILEGVRETYEHHHQVRISLAALEAAATLAQRYLKDRCMPGTALELLDEAASVVEMQRSLAHRLMAARKELEAVLDAKATAIRQQEYERVAALREKEVQARERIARLEADGRAEQPVVDAADIAQIISTRTGLSGPDLARGKP